MNKSVLLGVILLLVCGLLTFWSDVFPEADEGKPGDESIVKLESRDETREPEQLSLVSNRPNAVAADGFLGSESCKKCHADYHQSWHESYHRTMTQVVSLSSAPDIIRDKVVEIQGLGYEFTNSDDDFFVELNDPLRGGERAKRKLVMMTGSHSMQIFWYESDIKGTPSQLPICYLIHDQRWIPLRSAFLQPPHFQAAPGVGRWNHTCCNCHSTHPRQRPDLVNQQFDTQVADFGISCEACHGPGEAHIKFHDLENPQGLDQDPIVQPLDLPAKSRSDVCGRCHGIAILDFNVLDKDDYLTNGTSYRPGHVLDEAHFHKIVRASPEHWESDAFSRWNTSPKRLHGHFWADGHVKIAGRDYNAMIESACYERGEMSCMSCHTLHQQDQSLQADWRDDQLKPEMRGDQACLQCHQEYEALGKSHTHHAAESSGSRCMNCHMPHTTYGLQKTIRSHTISSPSVTSSIETGRPNACSLCHLDQTLAETADHLKDWYGIEVPELTDEEKSVAASVIHFLKGDASQRALQVAAMGRQEARDASLSDWMRPFLLIGMDDPYDVVRLMSHRTWKLDPTAPKLEYDFLMPQTERQSILAQELKKLGELTIEKPRATLLYDDQGKFDSKKSNQLLLNRNHREVFLEE